MPVPTWGRFLAKNKNSQLICGIGHNKDSLSPPVYPHHIICSSGTQDTCLADSYEEKEVETTQSEAKSGAKLQKETYLNPSIGESSAAGAGVFSDDEELDGKCSTCGLVHCC